MRINWVFWINICKLVVLLLSIVIKNLKLISLIVLFLTLSIIYGCSSDEAITEVTQPGELIEKKVNDDSNGKEEFKATFSTLDTNHTPKYITFKFNKNTWNLLVRDKLYELHFIYKNQSKKYVLEEINLSQEALNNFRQKIEEIR